MHPDHSARKMAPTSCAGSSSGPHAWEGDARIGHSGSRRSLRNSARPQDSRQMLSRFRKRDVGSHKLSLPRVLPQQSCTRDPSTARIWMCASSTRIRAAWNGEPIRRGRHQTWSLDLFCVSGRRTLLLTAQTGREHTRSSWSNNSKAGLSD